MQYPLVRISEVKEAMSQLNNTHLLDLPDELLVAIFNKLKPADVLCSIMDVSKQLDQLSYDRHFTTQMIDLTETSALDRFCSYILPRIRHGIVWLAIQSTDIERVLLAATYPNLTSLTLLHLRQEEIDKYFLEQPDVFSILKNQIKKLDVRRADDLMNRSSMTCDQILTTCTNLIRLTYKSTHPLSLNGLYLYQCTSSILIELNICVSYFSDCLFLLDGRLPQLKIFSIEIKHIQITRSESIDGIEMEPLLNMKIFSLTCYKSISMHTYEDWILSLLHRMSNLEQLSLWLSIEGDRFLTGSDLDKQILGFLPQLSAFVYRISTGVRVNHELQLQNDEIQRTFPIGQYNQFQASCTSLTFPGGARFCYIISQPYTLDRLDCINQKNFPVGIFTSVRSLMLCTNNQLAFEHEFFLRVSRSFPYLERLYIVGEEPQLSKDHSLMPVEFLRLKMLIFCDNIHLDYVEQFLLDTKTRLPSLNKLQINYDDLWIVTNAFTYAVTLVNCARVTQLYVDKQFVRTSAFNRYFPSLRVMRECRKSLWYRN